MHENTAWLATSGGIARYEPDRDRLKLYTDLTRFPDLNMSDAVKDGNGAIWFATRNGDLIRLDPVRETFVSYNALRAVGWQVNTLHAYRNHLFIGGPGGLSVFSIQKEFVISNVTQFGSLNRAEVIRVRSWGDSLAVLTGSGIAHTKVSNVAETNFADPNLWSTIEATGMLDIERKDDGSLVGTTSMTETIDGRRYGYGTSDCRLREDGEEVHQFSDIGGFAVVSCITKAGEDTYLIGTEGEHFWEWKRSSGSPAKHAIDGPVTSTISGMAFDGSGTLWYIGRDAKLGLGTYDGATWSSFSHNDPPDFGHFIMTRTQSDNSVMIARTGDVFIGTISHGIKWYDASKDSWTTFIDPEVTGAPFETPDNPLESLIPDNLGAWWTLVSGVCEDSSGFIWVANHLARNGNILHVFKPDMTDWRSFNVDEDNLRRPGGERNTVTGPVTAARRGDTNHIYLGFGKEGGVALLSYAGNPLTDSVRVQAPNQSISVADLAVEDTTRVWLAAQDGLYRVTDHRLSSLTKAKTPPMDKRCDAVAVVPRPGFSGGITDKTICDIAGDLGEGGVLSDAIAGLQRIVRPTEILVGHDGDLYAYRPVDQSVFSRLEQCGQIEKAVIVEIQDSLKDSVVNLTNNGSLGTVIRAIAAEEDPRFVWIGGSEGLFRFDRGTASTATGEENEDNRRLAAFPNPATLSSLRLNSSYRIRFTGVNHQSRLFVYTVSGERIRELPIKHVAETHNYYFEWDGRNGRGSLVRPGTYLYYAAVEGTRGKVGKLLLKP